MVFLTTNTFSRGNEFIEVYDTPGDVSSMSNDEIKDFIGKYGWRNNERMDYGTPITIASPIDKLPEGKEYREGYTGDVKDFGPAYYGEMERKRAENLVKSGHASFEDRDVRIDTYFNKVLAEAVDRNIIQLEREGGAFFMCDVVGLRMGYALKRDRPKLWNASA